MSYDHFAKTFSKSREKMHWPEIDYIVEFLEHHFHTKKIKILDAGCGNGRLLETLSNTDLSYEYLGIDASLSMIEEAQRLHPEDTFRVLDMKELERLDESFDAIIFIASFHHLESERMEEVLQETKKLLAEGGVIIMTNWNLLGEDLFKKYEKWYRWNGDFMIKIGTFERYYHGFTETELGDLFQEAGFAIEENRIFDGSKNILSMVRSS